MDSSNMNIVTTGDAGKIKHARPRARVEGDNVQNVDFLDIVNRLSAAEQSQVSGKTAKTKQTGLTQEAAGAQGLSGLSEVESAQTDEKVLGELDEIISEYGAENLNADILMELMSMYTTDTSVQTLVSSDDPLQTVQSSLYSAVLDQTPILSTGGEMIDEIADGYFDDLLSVMSSSKAVSHLLEALSTVQDADEFEKALQTISSITVTSEVNEVDRTVNALSEQLNLSKAVRSAKASIESGEMPVQTFAQTDEAPIIGNGVLTQTNAQPTQQTQPTQNATPQPVQPANIVQEVSPENVVNTAPVQTAQPELATQQTTQTAQQTAQMAQQTAQPERAAEEGFAQPLFTQQTAQQPQPIPQAQAPTQAADTAVQQPEGVMLTAAPEQPTQAQHPMPAAADRSADTQQTAQPQSFEAAMPQSDVSEQGYAQPLDTTQTPKAADTQQAADAQQTQQPANTESNAPIQTVRTQGRAQVADTKAPERAAPARNTQQTQAAQPTDNAPDSTAAQAMGFVDYNRGITPKEVMTQGAPEERAVFNQTLDLLSRAITEERQLYTARLHPEGLGEVIIRMEKSSAGVVFDILATNERTAQLINQKLAQLQTGMSEYEAKINPAVVTSSSNAESMSGFTFDDFTGGFGGRGENAYSGNRQRAGTRYNEAGEDEREAKTTGYRTTDVLNRTI